MFLSDNAYSSDFGTFLADSEYERNTVKIDVKKFFNAGATKKHNSNFTGIEFKRQDCEFVVPRQQARGSCIILELHVRAEPRHNLALCGTSQLGQSHCLYTKLMEGLVF